MILYPTETVYGLGVNALSEIEWQKLCDLKGREETKVASWLVRNLDDTRLFAEVSETAEKIASHFLPGPMTLVLPAKEIVPDYAKSEGGGVSFRISTDPLAQELIAAFWEKHQAPLTCTSANISGQQPERTVTEIVVQFKAKHPTFAGFDQVIDGGERSGAPSTVVRVFGDEIEILREGSVTKDDIMGVL